MSFDSVAESFLDVVRLLDEYNVSNTSRYDYRVLAAGVERAVIVQFGGVAFERTMSAAGNPRRINSPWNLVAELYIPYRGIDTIGEDAADEMQLILDHVDKYPTLNGASGVTNAFITIVSEPLPFDNNSRWTVITLTCVVNESSTAADAE